MSNIKVAVRVRPLSDKEKNDGSREIVTVTKNIVSIENVKVLGVPEYVDSRARVREFVFDHCYDCMLGDQRGYASQTQVFEDLGTQVLTEAVEGFNACVFAYGQTGTGKTYTMMGPKDDPGLIPRICEGLFSRVSMCAEDHVTCRIDLSYFEIYNERVRDLLQPELLRQNENYSLKVREHPKDGPHVKGLSWHRVRDNLQIQELLEKGNQLRVTAETYMHGDSSRSHAIVTICFTQVRLEDNSPSEIVSKIHLVDLAGSERADPSSRPDFRKRLTEGANINKSLVTLGYVIKALAERSLLSWSTDDMGSTQSFTSSAGGEVPPSSNSSGPNRPRMPFIPYRDSVLTYLLKDSLGGNSKTIMLATITPASQYYNESINTLRYAQRAKSIINKPHVNEDGNVALIRELRREIGRLHEMLATAQKPGQFGDIVYFVPSVSGPDGMEYQGGNLVSLSDSDDNMLAERLHENEEKAKQLTQNWMCKWTSTHDIMKESDLSIRGLRNRNSSVGVMVDSQLPYLVGMDDDILSTGVVIFHLKEGDTLIGTEGGSREPDIALTGPCILQEHCVIVNTHGEVILHPCQEALCAVQGSEVTGPTKLSQGDFIMLGGNQVFRFNNPLEAAKLREHRKSQGSLNTLSPPQLSFGGLSRASSYNSLGGDDPNYLSPLSHLSRSYPNYAASDLCRELERRHKSEQERIEQARLDVERLKAEHAREEEQRQMREEEMYAAHETHRLEIEEEKQRLSQLIDENERARYKAEEELQLARDSLLREKEAFQQQLEEEMRKLREQQKLEKPGQVESSGMQTESPCTATSAVGEDDVIMETEDSEILAGVVKDGRKMSVDDQIRELQENEFMRRMSYRETEESLALQQEDIEEQYLMTQETITAREKKIQQLEEQYRQLDQKHLQEIAAQDESIQQIHQREVQLEVYIQENEELLNVSEDTPRPLRSATSEMFLLNPTEQMDQSEYPSKTTSLQDIQGGVEEDVPESPRDLQRSASAESHDPDNTSKPKLRFLDAKKVTTKKPSKPITNVAKDVTSRLYKPPAPKFKYVPKQKEVEQKPASEPRARPPRERLDLQRSSPVRTIRDGTKASSASPQRKLFSKSPSPSPQRPLSNKSPSPSPQRPLSSKSPSPSPRRPLSNKSPSPSPQRPLSSKSPSPQRPLSNKSSSSSPQRPLSDKNARPPAKRTGPTSSKDVQAKKRSTVSPHKDVDPKSKQKAGEKTNNKKEEAKPEQKKSPPSSEVKDTADKHKNIMTSSSAVVKTSPERLNISGPVNRMLSPKMKHLSSASSLASVPEAVSEPSDEPSCMDLASEGYVVKKRARRGRSNFDPDDWRSRSAPDSQYMAEALDEYTREVESQEGSVAERREFRVSVSVDDSDICKGTDPHEVNIDEELEEDMDEDEDILVVYTDQEFDAPHECLAGETEGNLIVEEKDDSKSDRDLAGETDNDNVEQSVATSDSSLLGKRDHISPNSESVELSDVPEKKLREEGDVEIVEIPLPGETNLTKKAKSLDDVYSDDSLDSVSADSLEENKGCKLSKSLPAYLINNDKPMSDDSLNDSLEDQANGKGGQVDIGEDGSKTSLNAAKKCSLSITDIVCHEFVAQVPQLTQIDLDSVDVAPASTSVCETKSKDTQCVTDSQNKEVQSVDSDLIIENGKHLKPDLVNMKTTGRAGVERLSMVVQDPVCFSSKCTDAEKSGDESATQNGDIENKTIPNKIDAVEVQHEVNELCENDKALEDSRPKTNAEDGDTSSVVTKANEVLSEPVSPENSLPGQSISDPPAVCSDTPVKSSLPADSDCTQQTESGGKAVSPVPGFTTEETDSGIDTLEFNDSRKFGAVVSNNIEENADENVSHECQDKPSLKEGDENDNVHLEEHMDVVNDKEGGPEESKVDNDVTDNIKLNAVAHMIALDMVNTEVAKEDGNEIQAVGNSDIVINSGDIVMNSGDIDKDVESQSEDTDKSPASLAPICDSEQVSETQQETSNTSVQSDKQLAKESCQAGDEEALSMNIDDTPVLETDTVKDIDDNKENIDKTPLPKTDTVQEINYVKENIDDTPVLKTDIVQEINEIKENIDDTPVLKTDTVQVINKTEETIDDTPVHKTDIVQGKDGVEENIDETPLPKTDTVKEINEVEENIDDTPVLKTDTVQVINETEETIDDTPVHKTDIVQGKDGVEENIDETPLPKTETVKGINEIKENIDDTLVLKTDTVQVMNETEETIDDTPVHKTDIVPGKDGVEENIDETPLPKTDTVKGISEVEENIDDTTVLKTDTVQGINEIEENIDDTPVLKTDTVQVINETEETIDDTPVHKTDIVQGISEAEENIDDTTVLKTDTVNGINEIKENIDETPLPKTDTVKGINEVEENIDDTPVLKTDTVQVINETEETIGDTPVHKTDIVQGKDGVVENIDETPLPKTDTVKDINDVEESMDFTTVLKTETVQGINNVEENMDDTGTRKLELIVTNYQDETFTEPKSKRRTRSIGVGTSLEYLGPAEFEELGANQSSDDSSLEPAEDLHTLQQTLDNLPKPQSTGPQLSTARRAARQRRAMLRQQQTAGDADDSVGQLSDDSPASVTRSKPSSRPDSGSRRRRPRSSRSSEKISKGKDKSSDDYDSSDNDSVYSNDSLTHVTNGIVCNDAFRNGDAILGSGQELNSVSSIEEADDMLSRHRRRGDGRAASKRVTHSEFADVDEPGGGRSVGIQTVDYLRRIRSTGSSSVRTELSDLDNSFASADLGHVNMVVSPLSIWNSNDHGDADSHSDRNSSSSAGALKPFGDNEKSFLSTPRSRERSVSSVFLENSDLSKGPTEVWCTSASDLSRVYEIDEERSYVIDTEMIMPVAASSYDFSEDAQSQHSSLSSRLPQEDRSNYDPPGCSTPINSGRLVSISYPESQIPRGSCLDVSGPVTFEVTIQEATTNIEYNVEKTEYKTYALRPQSPEEEKKCSDSPSVSKTEDGSSQTQDEGVRHHIETIVRQQSDEDDEKLAPNHSSSKEECAVGDIDTDSTEQGRKDQNDAEKPARKTKTLTLQSSGVVESTNIPGASSDPGNGSKLKPEEVQCLDESDYTSDYGTITSVDGRKGFMSFTSDDSDDNDSVLNGPQSISPRPPQFVQATSRTLETVGDEEEVSALTQPQLSVCSTEEVVFPGAVHARMSQSSPVQFVNQPLLRNDNVVINKASSSQVAPNNDIEDEQETDSSSVSTVRTLNADDGSNFCSQETLTDNLHDKEITADQENTQNAEIDAVNSSADDVYLSLDNASSCSSDYKTPQQSPRDSEEEDIVSEQVMHVRIPELETTAEGNEPLPSGFKGESEAPILTSSPKRPNNVRTVSVNTEPPPSVLQNQPPAVASSSIGKSQPSNKDPGHVELQRKELQKKIAKIQHGSRSFSDSAISSDYTDGDSSSLSPRASACFDIDKSVLRHFDSKNYAQKIPVYAVSPPQSSKIQNHERSDKKSPFRDSGNVFDGDSVDTNHIGDNTNTGMSQNDEDEPVTTNSASIVSAALATKPYPVGRSASLDSLSTIVNVGRRPVKLVKDITKKDNEKSNDESKKMDAKPKNSERKVNLDANQNIVESDSEGEINSDEETVSETQQLRPLSPGEIGLTNGSLDDMYEMLENGTIDPPTDMPLSASSKTGISGKSTSLSDLDASGPNRDYLRSFSETNIDDFEEENNISSNSNDSITFVFMKKYADEEHIGSEKDEDTAFDENVCNVSGRGHPSPNSSGVATGELVRSRSASGELEQQDEEENDVMMSRSNSESSVKMNELCPETKLIGDDDDQGSTHSASEEIVNIIMHREVSSQQSSELTSATQIDSPTSYTDNSEIRKNQWYNQDDDSSPLRHKFGIDESVLPISERSQSADNLPKRVAHYSDLQRSRSTGMIDVGVIDEQESESGIFPPAVVYVDDDTTEASTSLHTMSEGRIGNLSPSFHTNSDVCGSYSNRTSADLDLDTSSSEDNSSAVVRSVVSNASSLASSVEEFREEIVINYTCNDRSKQRHGSSRLPSTVSSEGGQELDDEEHIREVLRTVERFILPQPVLVDRGMSTQTDESESVSRGIQTSTESISTQTADPMPTLLRPDQILLPALAAPFRAQSMDSIGLGTASEAPELSEGAQSWCTLGQLMNETTQLLRRINEKLPDLDQSSICSSEESQSIIQQWNEMKIQTGASLQDLNTVGLQTDDFEEVPGFNTGSTQVDQDFLGQPLCPSDAVLSKLHTGPSEVTPCHISIQTDEDLTNSQVPETVEMSMQTEDDFDHSDDILISVQPKQKQNEQSVNESFVPDNVDKLSSSLPVEEEQIMPVSETGINQSPVQRNASFIPQVKKDLGLDQPISEKPEGETSVKQEESKKPKSGQQIPGVLLPESKEIDELRKEHALLMENLRKASEERKARKEDIKARKKLPKYTKDEKSTDPQTKSDTPSGRSKSPKDPSDDIVQINIQVDPEAGVQVQNKMYKSAPEDSKDSKQPGSSKETEPGLTQSHSWHMKADEVMAVSDERLESSESRSRSVSNTSLTSSCESELSSEVARAFANQNENLADIIPQSSRSVVVPKYINEDDLPKEHGANTPNSSQGTATPVEEVIIPEKYTREESVPNFMENNDKEIPASETKLSATPSNNKPATNKLGTRKPEVNNLEKAPVKNQPISDEDQYPDFTDAPSEMPECRSSPKTNKKQPPSLRHADDGTKLDVSFSDDCTQTDPESTLETEVNEVNSRAEAVPVEIKPNKTVPEKKPGKHNHTANLPEELDQLQNERHQILELLGMPYLPTSLTVELLEAKLNYCIGQTDLLLDNLEDSFPEDERKKPLTAEQKNIKDYVTKYRSDLKKSKEDIKECQERLNKPKKEVPLGRGRGRAPTRRSDLMNKHRQAEVEAFKLERMREQTDYERSRHGTPQKGNTPMRGNTPLYGNSPDVTPRSERSRSSSPSYSPGYMTPREHREHLADLRRQFIRDVAEEEERHSRSCSPNLLHTQTPPRLPRTRTTSESSTGFSPHPAALPGQSSPLLARSPNRQSDPDHRLTVLSTPLEEMLRRSSFSSTSSQRVFRKYLSSLRKGNRTRSRSGSSHTDVCPSPRGSSHRSCSPVARQHEPLSLNLAGVHDDDQMYSPYSAYAREHILPNERQPGGVLRGTYELYNNGSHDRSDSSSVNSFGSDTHSDNGRPLDEDTVQRLRPINATDIKSRLGRHKR